MDDDVQRLKARIRQLNAELEQCHEQRAQLMARQCQSRTQRDVAQAWDLSHPAVVYALRRTRGLPTHRSR